MKSTVSDPTPDRSVLADVGVMLAASGLLSEGQRVLVVGSDEEGASAFPRAEVESLGRLESANDVPDSARADIGIVVQQLEYLSKRDGTHLLARLRDVHCRRVAVVLGDESWSRDELLALGFLPVEMPAAGRPMYLFDPDLFHEPRDWNNPQDWANPQNFDKYRW